MPTSIATILERGVRALVLALPFELRIAAAAAVAILVLLRAARTVPLNSAFSRQRPRSAPLPPDPSGKGDLVPRTRPLRAR
jgi:hypothetical protein